MALNLEGLSAICPFYRCIAQKNSALKDSGNKSKGSDWSFVASPGFGLGSGLCIAIYLGIRILRFKKKGKKKGSDSSGLVGCFGTELLDSCWACTLS
jgi:hypothetical protein